jgi:TPR repeat protein
MRNVIFAAFAAIWACASGAAIAQTEGGDVQAGRERACEAGDAAACGQAARAFIGPDAPRARAFLERGCTGGDRLSCRALGVMLVSGAESGRDYARAAPLLDAACAEGTGAACGLLANLVYLGEGVPADPRRALTLAERGCALEDARACAAFGLFFVDGRGLPTRSNSRGTGAGQGLRRRSSGRVQDPGERRGCGRPREGSAHAACSGASTI